MNEIFALRIRLLAEKEQLVSRLNVLGAILAELPSSGDEVIGRPPPVPKASTNGRKRAPRGSLPDAIKAVLKAKPGMTNAEIRAGISAKGYSWPLGAIHVSKNLLKLVANDEISSKRTGKIFRYTLK